MYIHVIYNICAYICVQLLLIYMLQAFLSVDREFFSSIDDLLAEKARLRFSVSEVIHSLKLKTDSISVAALLS